jgi:hypothetical protein
VELQALGSYPDDAWPSPYVSVVPGEDALFAVREDGVLERIGFGK